MRSAADILQDSCQGPPAGVDLSRRIHDPELMDDFGIRGAEIDTALRELRVINRYLGGVSSSLSALKPLLRGRRRPVRLLDVGTGGADIPIAIVRWCRRAGIPIRIAAIDLGRDACRFADRASRAYPEIQIYNAEVFALPFAPRSFDLAHCAMFLHHFTQEQIVAMLDRLAALVRAGIVINDLHRHAFAYHSIRLLTRLWSRSRLARNDAPLSVRRGFRLQDLHEIRDRSAFASFEIRWHWAFRYVCYAAVAPAAPARVTARGERATARAAAPMIE